LCERPLALTLPGVERVLQAGEKYGKRVMVGMNHRFRSDVQAVRGFLAGGDLGVLQAIRCGWYTFQPSRNMVAWRLRRQEAGGGFKELHGSVADMTPRGATGRETPFAQSYRAEWTYFLAVIRGDVNAPPPRDQLALHRVLDAVYRSADEGRDVLL